MRRIDWVIVLVPLFLVWGVDRATKAWAEGLRGVSFYGPFGFVLHHNHGAMLGLFSDLPAVLRIVSLSTGGAFLLFTFAIVQYLLPIKSLTLRSGLSMLLGGILGNVTDRIMYGYVIDFLIIGSPRTPSPAFNLADALQWVGYGMVAWALVSQSAILWPEANTRKAYWVNLKFQLRYCFILMGIGLGFAVIAGVYSYTFLRVTILDLVGNNPRLLDHYLLPFVATFMIVSFGFSAILFLAGRTLSQRIAGPLYAFERFLDDALVGKKRTLRLRAGDEFPHLEKVAQRVLEELAARSPAANSPAEPTAQPDASAASSGSETIAGVPIAVTGTDGGVAPQGPVGGVALRRASNDPR